MTEQIDDTPRLWAKEHRSVVLGVLGLMTFIAFESFAVTTALPVVAADLNAEQWYSLAYAATLTTGLIGMTIGGNWVDRRGVATPLLVGGSIFLTGILLCVVAPNMEVFVAGRLLQGIGGGIDSVVIYVVIAQFLPESIRARMFGLLTAAWLLPGIAGPLLTGVLVEFVGWRLVFAIVLAGAGLSLLSLLNVVRRSGQVRSETPVFGRRGTWAVAGALGVLTLHLAAQQHLTIQVIGTAAAVIVIAVAATQLLPKGTLRFRSGVPRLTALRGLLGATVAATDIYLPLYLQHEANYSPTRSGLVVAIGALGWVVGAWIQGRSADAAGDPSVLRRASGLVLLGPVAAALFVADFVPIFVPVVGCILMGVGMGLAYPQITAAVLNRSTETEQGTNSSALQISESISQSVLLAVTGAILAFALGNEYLSAYALVASIGLVALLTTTTIRDGAKESIGSKSA